MRLINNTRWNSKKLKRFLVLCKNEDDRIEGKIKSYSGKSRELKVEVVYIKSKESCYYDGYAYYNGTYTRLRVPRPEVIQCLDLKKLAWLFFHEYQHIRGYHHKQMNDAYDFDFIEKAFKQKRIETITADEEIEIAAFKPNKEDKFQKKLDSAKRRLTKAEKQYISSIRLMKKWKAKVKYYENKIQMKGGQN